MGGRPVAASRWLGGQLSVYPQNVRGIEYCVDSVNGNSRNNGKDWDNALPTIAEADLLARPNMGDHIWLAPGHVETMAAAPITLATAGVTISGVPDAVDSDMPRFDYTDAASSLVLGADNIILRNIALRPHVTDVLIGVDIAAGSTGCLVEKCYFMQGADGGGLDDFAACIELKAGCHDTLIHKNRLRSHAAAAGYANGINLNGVSCRVIIEDNLIQGNFSAAGIGNTAGVCDVLLAKDNIIKVADAGVPGINLQATTNGILTGNMIESTGINPDVAIVAAACAWFGNYCVAVDGTPGELIGTASETVAAEGSVFWVFKQLTSSDILTTGVPVTGVAAVGEIAIEDWVLKTDAATGLAAGTNFELTTDNARGEVAAGFGVETVANLGALKTVDKAETSVTGQNTILEVGKKVIAECTDVNCTGAGTIDVYLKCRRLAAGATLAAA